MPSRPCVTRLQVLRCAAAAAVSFGVLAPMRTHFSAAALAADPLMDELTEEARILSLPSERARALESLQTLEDERLERCRDRRAGSAFDQCFFFGTLGGDEGAAGSGGSGGSGGSSAGSRRGASRERDGERQRPGPRTW